MLVAQLRRERSRLRDGALDLGTGSGVLAIAGAQVGYGPVVAVDVSRAALTMARLNARLNGVRVEARFGHLFSAVPGQRFDLILANPPYVPSPAKLARPRRTAGVGGRGGRTGVHRSDLRPGGRASAPGRVLLLVHSGVCGEQATLHALGAGGLKAVIAYRHLGPLGPILQERQSWLQSRGLLAADSEELW